MVYVRADETRAADDNDNQHTGSMGDGEFWWREVFGGRWPQLSPAADSVEDRPCSTMRSLHPISTCPRMLTVPRWTGEQASGVVGAQRVLRESFRASSPRLAIGRNVVSSMQTPCGDRTGDVRAVNPSAHATGLARGSTAVVVFRMVADTVATTHGDGRR